MKDLQLGVVISLLHCTFVYTRNEGRKLVQTSTETYLSKVGNNTALHLKKSLQKPSWCNLLIDFNIGDFYNVAGETAKKILVH